MKVRVQPRDIDVVADDPFAHDVLDRKEQISVLTSVIKAIDGPCVLGIDGPWGSGKTTFIRMWAQHLLDEKFPVVSFNAWETDFSDDPFLALSDEISQALQEYRGRSFDAKIEKVLEKSKEVAIRATPAVIRILTAGVLDVSTILEQELGQTLASYAQEKVSAYRGAQRSLRDFRNSLQDAALSVSDTEGGLPLVVVIDELDRCRPSYAVGLLEIAKHLFSVDRVVFILAVNREQLAHSVCALYGNNFDGEGYLRRFFDIELRLPDPNRKRFIENALGSIQIDDYFSRTKDQQAGRAYQQIRLMLSAFFAGSDLSLRNINQAIHHLGLVLATLRSDRQFLGFSAAVALILRTLDPATYREFTNREIEDAEVAQRTFTKIEIDDEDTVHQKALFEAVLIVGSLEMQSRGRYLSDQSVTPLLERYQAVVANAEQNGPRDGAFAYAYSVLGMVRQFRNEAAMGTPPGFLHTVSRLELLSPDLVSES